MKFNSFYYFHIKNSIKQGIQCSFLKIKIENLVQCYFLYENNKKN